MSSLFAASSLPESSSANPWDIDPALTPKRLLLLAQVAVGTRNQAHREANRDLGDTNWGIGCKAHERFVHAVAKLAATASHSWLRVHRDGLSFTSFIEGVAVRAYRGEADHPSARHVYAAQHESDREPKVDPRQLAFGFEAARPAEDAEDASARWVWLMAVETDPAGCAVRVVFFQANALGQSQNRWVAPLGEVAEVRAPAAVRARTPRRGSAARASLSLP
jgi:hypothetical protein